MELKIFGNALNFFSDQKKRQTDVLILVLLFELFGNLNQERRCSYPAGRFPTWQAGAPVICRLLRFGLPSQSEPED